jgi:hypothetical protein
VEEEVSNDPLPTSTNAPVVVDVPVEQPNALFPLVVVMLQVPPAMFNVPLVPESYCMNIP